MNVSKKLVKGVYHLRYTENGQDRKRSTYTSDAKEAEKIRRTVEAALLLGQPSVVPRPCKKAGVPEGPWTPYEDFLEIYRSGKLQRQRKTYESGTLSRLRMCQRAGGFKTLGDASDASKIEKAQDRMLRDGKSRWTIKTAIDALMTALKWAKKRGWVGELPLIDRIKTSKLKGMKGRPIEAVEFQQMLKAVPSGLVKKTTKTIPPITVASWQFLLRGYWTSSLRLEELLQVHWTDPDQIVPVWPEGQFPYLKIPSAMQKNDTEEAIPLLPEFSELLQLIPQEQRVGWVFNPIGTKYRETRPQPDWVGKIIQRIGKAAGVVTYAAKGIDHYATTHDLRRSCAQRLVDAGVDERIIQAVMRHQSFETTRRFYTMARLQRDAATLWKVHSVKAS